MSGNTLNGCTAISSPRTRHRSPTLQATRHRLSEITDKTGALRAELELLTLPAAANRELDDIDDLIRIVHRKMLAAWNVLDTLIECEGV